MEGRWRTILWEGMSEDSRDESVFWWLVKAFDTRNVYWGLTVWQAPTKCCMWINSDFLITPRVVKSVGSGIGLLEFERWPCHWVSCLTLCASASSPVEWPSLFSGCTIHLVASPSLLVSYTVYVMMFLSVYLHLESLPWTQGSYMQWLALLYLEVQLTHRLQKRVPN